MSQCSRCLPPTGKVSQTHDVGIGSRAFYRSVEASSEIRTLAVLIVVWKCFYFDFFGRIEAAGFAFSAGSAALAGVGADLGGGGLVVTGKALAGTFGATVSIAGFASPSFAIGVAAFASVAVGASIMALGSMEPSGGEALASAGALFGSSGAWIGAASSHSCCPSSAAVILGYQGLGCGQNPAKWAPH